MTLPLLSSPPPQDVEEGIEKATAAHCADGGEGEPRPVRPTSAGANNKTSPPAQATAKGTEQVPNQEPPDGCDIESTEKSDIIVWEEQEVPASKESFFFAVPPLSELVGFSISPGDQDAAGAVAAIPEDQSVGGKPQPVSVSPTSPAEGRGDQDGTDDAAPEEINTTVSLLVSLNGNDWQSVSGPSLTYFQPPPEPVVEAEEETKKGKGRKK